MKPALAALLALIGQTAQADIRFADASDAFGVEHAYTGDWHFFVGGGVAVFDCNGDNYPDIFAAGGASPARLFINQGTLPLAFAEGTAIDALSGVTGAYPLDINGDGHVDLAVLRAGPNLLLQGDGDCGFIDASAAWGFASDDRWSTAFSATWERGQDHPTLAIGNYVDRADPNGPFEACDINQLYRPTPAGYATTTLEPGFCALSMLFSDWQRTGQPELRISNDRHYYVRGGYEQMWQLQPLQERDTGWDKVSIWGMGIASADLQNDGFPDVMLTSMGDQVLQFNESGRMVAAGYDTGTTAHRPHVGDDGRPSTGWHAEFGDINNDGLLDLFMAKGNVDQMPSNAIDDPNNLLMQTPGGTFKEVSDTAGLATVARSRGAALADFDLDGLLDVVVVNRRAPLELWLNRSTDLPPAASVDLRMDGGNRFGIGAWLEIDRGDRTEWRERTVGGGHVSGSLLPFHIGLGDADSLRLRVHWPDGQLGEWVTIGAGARQTLRP